MHRRPERLRKSTLLNIIAGFLAPSAGEIRVAGQQVSGYGMDRGVVFQDFAQLFPWRTALGNAAFGLEMKGVAKAEREEIALEQLRLVKLENFAKFLDYQKKLLHLLGQKTGQDSGGHD